MHQTSLDLGGVAVIAIYFVAILGVGSVVKAILRASDRREEQAEQDQADYFAHLREEYDREGRR